MVGQSPGRTFISYSRKDSADFARDLRATLEKEHLSFWQDLVALEGGQDWWSQIENVLRSKDLQHFILVVTPKALESGVAKQEIRLARQEGKSVCPIKGPGVIDLNKLPRWLGHVYDLVIAEQRTALVGKLQRDAEPRRAPMMAPELSADFVARPNEFDALKARLLDPEGDLIAGITAALRGAGGYGKTTLAKVLARVPEIQDAYFDGILWAELGEKPERLIATLSDLVTMLSGERPQHRRLEHALLQSPKGRRQLSERRAITQGSRLALNDRQIVPPVENRRGALSLVRACEDATVFADDLPLGDDEDALGIYPHAYGAIGKGGRHAVAIALQMDQARWRHALGVFDEAVERPGKLHQTLDLFGPGVGHRASLRAVQCLSP